jgi:hypothetical protein
VPKGLDQDEPIERWTLIGEKLERCRAKPDVNGLAFAVL